MGVSENPLHQGGGVCIGGLFRGSVSGYVSRVCFGGVFRIFSTTMTGTDPTTYTSTNYYYTTNYATNYTTNYY